MEEHHGICLGVVGSRNYRDWDDFKKRVNDWIEKKGMPTIIVSGGARGADSMAERFADERKIAIEVLPPDYNTYGRYAPLQRNSQIARLCTHLLAFPSHKGSGTQDTIAKAKKMKKDVEVFYID